jgi:hypothetical protein
MNAVELARMRSARIFFAVQFDEMRGKIFLRVDVFYVSELLRITVGGRGKQAHFSMARIHSSMLNDDRHI